MKKFEVDLFRIKSITGMFYKGVNPDTKRLIIFGIGAPLPPDDGDLPEASDILRFDTDLFVPDYIGYGRSDGLFTPMNCINTFLDLFSSFSKGCVAQNYYQNLRIFRQYKEIHFIGSSFGGMYVLLLPRFNPTIKNIAVVYPILDYVECGHIPGEEKVKNFLLAMEKDGYKHLYRGIMKPIWKKHLGNQDGLRPIENIKFLQRAKVFIAHGKKDKNINFSHSVKFFKKLTAVFPDRKNQFKLKIYPSGEHNEETSKLAVVDYLNWLTIPRNV